MQVIISKSTGPTESNMNNLEKMELGRCDKNLF